MFYRGVMFGLEIAHNEIARHLYRAIHQDIPSVDEPEAVK
jgi:hypothetical protein